MERSAYGLELVTMPNLEVQFLNGRHCHLERSDLVLVSCDRRLLLLYTYSPEPTNQIQGSEKREWELPEGKSRVTHIR